ncbi:MAG: molecular chaperone DnaK, partial [Isosphaeraceae bacterium]
KLSESDKSAVQSAIEKVREAVKGDDPSVINRAFDDLQRASQAMAEHLYTASAGPGATGPGAADQAGDPSANGGAGEPKADDVIDVEFEEKK